MPARMDWSSPVTITVEPLTPSSFAPFGTVIQNPRNAAFPVPPASIKANQGSATKFADVSPLVSSYDLAKSGKPAMPRLSMFSCKPRHLDRDTSGRRVFSVAILERHPFTPQTFVPIGLSAEDKETAYLVIVAPTMLKDECRVRLPTYEVPHRPVPSGISASNQIAVRTASPKTSGPPDLANMKAFVARGDQAVTYGAGTWHAPMVVLGKQTVDFVVVQYTNGVPEDDCQEVEIKGGKLDVHIADDLVSKGRARL